MAQGDGQETCFQRLGFLDHGGLLSRAVPEVTVAGLQVDGGAGNCYETGRPCPSCTSRPSCLETVLMCLELCKLSQAF